MLLAQGLADALRLSEAAPEERCVSAGQEPEGSWLARVLGRLALRLEALERLARAALEPGDLGPGEAGRFSLEPVAGGVVAEALGHSLCLARSPPRQSHPGRADLVLIRLRL